VQIARHIMSRAPSGSRPRFARLALAGLVTATVLSACGDNKSTEPKTPTAASIVLSGGGTIPVSGTSQFAAVVKDADGNVLDVHPTWSIVAGGGTISTNGLFTAGDSAGTFTNTVKAAIGSVSATSSVTVTAGSLATITIAPATTTLGISATQQFTAVAKDAHGNVLDIRPTWSAGAGGTIDSTGLFTAGTTVGSFAKTVVATSGDIADSASVDVGAGALASITVTPASATLATGATQQYVAVGKDAADNVVSITPTWSVAAGGGTIDAAGLFTAGSSAGTFSNTVTATSGAISGTASVTVTGGVVASMTLTPASQTLATGATQQYTAVAKDVNGNVVPVTPTWSVAAGGGTIDDAGLFTAGTVAGTFTNTVTATSGTVTATATVVVSPGPVTSYVITPTPVSVAAGATQRFTAVAKDANNNIVPVTTGWTVGAPGGGTIDNDGLFTAGTVTGTYTNTIVATSDTLAATATVTVTAGALATITVTPLSATVSKSTGVVNFDATGKDAYGNVVTISPVWTLSSPNAGTITPSGLFHAGTVLGTYTVKATVGTIFGTATVTLQ